MKYKKELISLLGLIGAMLLYIHTPSIPVVGEKVVRLTDDRLLLVLPSSTGLAEIQFKYAVNVRNLIITPVIEGQEVSRGLTGEIDGYKNVVAIIPSSFVDPGLLATAKEIRVDLALSKQFPHPEITGASIDGADADLSAFYKEYVRSASSRLISTREIQNDISHVLIKYNESISNYVISLMAATCATLLLFMALTAPRTYLASDKSLLTHIKKKYGMKETVTDHLIEEAKYRLGSDYAKINRWSRLLQTSGPALGFMLTVSSLIVALYPTVYSGADITTFFNAIQIAMISTFVGLFLRIEAIAIQVINNSRLMRYDEILARLSP